MNPLVVRSSLPLPSGVESVAPVPRSFRAASTSVPAVKLIVVAELACWIEMSRPARASANV
jgi:hypothetical protein